jgi:hypothetical protein
MCARTVRMQRKPNSVAQFNQTLANDTLPLLRTQPGFQDEMTFVVPGGMEMVVSVYGCSKSTPKPITTAHLSRRAESLGARGGGQAAGAPLYAAHVTFHTSLAWRRSLTLRELWWGVGPLWLPSRLFGVLSPLPTERPDEEKGGKHDGGRHAEYREA